MPVPYYSGWQYLGQHLGEGLAKGATERIGEERELERTERGFRRLAPLRREKFQEELGYETERGRAKGTMEAEFKQAQEAREAESALGSIGPYLSEMLSTTEFPGAAGERRQEQATPYEVPAGTRKEDIYKLLDIGKEREKLKKPTAGRAPTMTELYIAASQGDPTAKAAIKEYQTTQVDIFGGKFDVPGTRAPDISPSERGALSEVGALRTQLKGIAKMAKPGYVGALQGRTGALGERLGWIGTEQADFRQGVETLARELRKKYYGSALTGTELALALRSIPNANMSDVQFEAALKATEKWLSTLEQETQKQLTKPRRMPLGRGTPRPGWELVE